MPFALKLWRWLLALATGVALLVGVDALAVSAGRPQRQKSSAGHPPSLPVPAAGGPRPADAGLALQWRAPWPAWQLLSWAIATLLAPGFWLTGGLLLVNPRCDHPAFWWSLPAIVALGHAAAIVAANQHHHRRPFMRRGPLALRGFGAGMRTGCALFLLAGWASGFLPDTVVPVASAASAEGSFAAAVLWTVAATTAFGVLSFAHGGAVHACLGFARDRLWREGSCQA